MELVLVHFSFLFRPNPRLENIFTILSPNPLLWSKGRGAPQHCQGTDSTRLHRGAFIYGAKMEGTPETPLAFIQAQSLRPLATTHILSRILFINLLIQFKGCKLKHRGMDERELWRKGGKLVVMLVCGTKLTVGWFPALIVWNFGMKSYL